MFLLFSVAKIFPSLHAMADVGKKRDLQQAYSSMFHVSHFVKGRRGETGGPPLNEEGKNGKGGGGVCHLSHSIDRREVV